MNYSLATLSCLINTSLHVSLHVCRAVWRVTLTYLSLVSVTFPIPPSLLSSNRVYLILFHRRSWFIHRYFVTKVEIWSQGNSPSTNYSSKRPMGRKAGISLDLWHLCTVCPTQETNSMCAFRAVGVSCVVSIGGRDFWAACRSHTHINLLITWNIHMAGWVICAKGCQLSGRTTDKDSVHGTEQYFLLQEVWGVRQFLRYVCTSHS